MRTPATGSARERGEPSIDLSHPARSLAGAGLPDRVRRARHPRRAYGATAARRLRAGAPESRAAATLRPPRSRSQPRARRACPQAGGPVRGQRQRACPRPLASRATGCLRRAAPPHHARRLRALAARQPQSRHEHSPGDGRPFCRPPRSGARDLEPGRAAALRSDQRPRLQLSRGRGRGRRPRVGATV